MGEWGGDVNDSIDFWNVFGIRYKERGITGPAHCIPFTAACRSDVIKSSMATAANLSPKDW